MKATNPVNANAGMLYLPQTKMTWTFGYIWEMKRIYKLQKVIFVEKRRRRDGRLRRKRLPEDVTGFRHRASFR